MYACITNYDSLYNDAYRERRADHTSFDRGVLPKEIAERCSQLNCTRLLDVSGGQGNLGKDLAAWNIDTVTTDIGSLPGSDVIPFNLASHSQAATEEILRARNPGGGAYLTTCLDVLEHIDREHLGAAVHNLASLTDKYLIVSISTRPSAFDNLLHCTLLPINAWIKAFEAANMRLVEMDIFPDAQLKIDFPVNDDFAPINHWQKADPFGDIADGEPRYLLLEKAATTPGYEDLLGKVDQITDVAYRRLKRQSFQLKNDAFFNFNIHHSQDWSLLRPFLDVLPRDRVRFLIRTDYIPSLHLRSIRSFLYRNNVPVLEYNQIEELPWSLIKGQIIVSAAESTAGISHLKSFEVVATARLHGCATFLVQHGVWPRAIEDRVLTFASHRILTWGREEKRRVNEKWHSTLDTEVPWGVFDDDQEVAIGSAKLCDQLIGPFTPLGLKFGYDDESYSKAVVVGAKNVHGRWSLPANIPQFVDEFEKLASDHADTFFVLRPHPADSIEPYADLKLKNVRILDDVISALADMPINRVLPTADLLATSPSSFIADGAVSGLPVFVYETGQPIEFDGVNTRPFGELTKLLGSSDAIGKMRRSARNFKELYTEAVDDQFYAKCAPVFDTMRETKVDRNIATSATLARIAVKQANSGGAI